MMTRARAGVTPQIRADIVRLFTRRRPGLKPSDPTVPAGYGSRHIASLLGLSRWCVRRVLAEEGLSRGRQRPWSVPAPPALRPKGWGGPYTHDDHLRNTAGERGVRRLARELGRTSGAIRKRLSELAMSLPELRIDLTLRQAAEVTPWCEATLLARIRRKELPARREDGAWRINSSALRAYMREHIPEVLAALEARRITRGIEALSLLAGQWGTSEESERRARKARREAAEVAG